MDTQTTDQRESAPALIAVNAEVEEVRRLLVDRILAAMSLMSIPLLLLAVVRVVEHGFRRSFVIQGGLVAALILTWWFRRRLPLGVRTAVFVLAFALAGFLGLFAFGLSGLGLLFLFGFCVVLSAIRGSRWGYAALYACALVIAGFGFAVSRGWVAFDFDAGQYLTSGSAWCLATVGFLLIPGMVIWIVEEVWGALGQSSFAALAHAAALERANQALDVEVAERRRSEAALRQAAEQLTTSEEMLRAITDSAQDSIFCKDASRRYTFVNPAMEKILGRSAADLLGRTPEDIFDAQTAAIIAAVDKPVLQGETISEVRELSLKGGPHTLHTVQLPLRGEGGAVVGICGIVRDIGELVAAQKRSLELQERLERAERVEALGLLAGGVAHDLNNTLNPLVALTDDLHHELAALHRRLDGDRVALSRDEVERILEAMDVINRSAQRGALVIGDLLAFSRRGQMVRCPVDLCHLLRECREAPDIRAGAAVREAFVSMSVPADGLWVVGSESHLQRSVLNLVRNALEAVNAGGRVEISLQKVSLSEPYLGYETVPAGDYAKITVADTGHGIRAADVNRIFEPFFTTREAGGHSGSGLGLSIVHGVIKDHDGYIDVQGTPGGGTTFRLFLPLSPAMSPTPAAPATETPAGGAGERILVVDDDAAQRFTAERILSSRGYAVDSAADADAAMRLARDSVSDANGAYGLAILDMRMGSGPDGLEVLQRLRQVLPGLQAIIASGYAPDSRGEAAASLGAYWLAKPYRGAELVRAVREQLDRGATG